MNRREFFATAAGLLPLGLIASAARAEPKTCQELVPNYPARTYTYEMGREISQEQLEAISRVHVELLPPKHGWVLEGAIR